jgi:recombinase
MSIYGYARISTDLQDLTRQKTKLVESGVAEENIFVDIGTGKDFNRIQLRKLVDKTIKNGDTIYICSLDRLGRDIRGIEEEYNLITNKRGCTLISIAEPFLKATGIQEIDNLINPIILKLLSWFADREREQMLQRQKQAYDSMKKNEKGKLISNRTGEPVGRKAKSKQFTKEQKQILKDWIEETGELSTKYVLLVLKVSRPTLFKLKKQYQNGELKI